MPIEVLMPALSPTMEEGTLAKWNVKVGDTVSSGDVIAEIETDKATMEVEAVDEGKVAKILVEEGTEGVKVNALIAVLLEEGEDESAAEGFTGKSSAAPAAAPAPAATSSEAPKASGASAPAAPAAKEGDRIKASPLAKRLAKEKGLDLAQVTGSGPYGRIVKRDVEGAKSGAAPQAAHSAAGATPQASAPAPQGDKITVASLNLEEGRYEVQSLDGMRKTIAKRLTKSFRDVPHFPLSVDVELDNMLKLRKELNAKAPEGVKISVNDMLIRACALALKKVPASNASYTDEGIVLHKHADVSVAVAIDGGLITPVIKEAENKGLAVISAEMKDLATRARERKLKPEEYQGGTFSLSNLGMFAIKAFASIINEPQGMIMSVGAGEERAVVKDGALAIANVMSVTVTCDHRVVDGSVGAKFIQAFKGYAEDPVTMLF
ncbi:pyruvate dehydrogenase complex dihydrolipoamide acetyltransferase [Woodsholea maritima]|uniref:pyruvate dehydrogenase complex dihydrolipoamide acetyltransferase n=1 Tax=Woodsholea maritima TaxID=240237 RepID=UPI000379F1B1|nr:pyruvate dehydrogenase complex dihydrolipoamide acetyltransferase [Woodsholea maritima]